MTWPDLRKVGDKKSIFVSFRVARGIDSVKTELRQAELRYTGGKVAGAPWSEIRCFPLAGIGLEKGASLKHQGHPEHQKTWFRSL
jgi:hypothetical protein